MQKTEKFHFIGIGGIGMSGLARILLKKNLVVSGSDIASSYVIEGLLQDGAQVFLGHSSQHIPDGATIIYNSDIKKDNPEYQTAVEQNFNMMHRSDLLLHLMKGYKTLAIAGTHGKTTTSSLLTWVMKQGGKDPSFAVGGMIPQFHSNAGHGEGEFFVAEADESDGTFLKYDPYGAIVTNIDSDHLNHYGSMAALVEAFHQFLEKVGSAEHLFWCGDDPYLQKLSPKGISYGMGKNCQLRISGIAQKGWSLNFNLDFQGKHYANIQLSLVGHHNALNGAAVFGLALNLGVPEIEIRKAFQSFGGVMRRCEKKGEIQNILLLDDYAHHPTEIKTTLKGIRQAIGGRRLIAVFQPHRYTRTRDCLGLFQDIFDAADEIFIPEIYGAGESPIAGLSSKDIIKEIESHSMKKCHFIPRKEMASVLADFLRTHDVMVTLGAGDITKLSYELLHLFTQKIPKKLKVGILFGGRSSEHEVTFLSAHHICHCVSHELYDVQHFGITKQGQWIVGGDSMQRLKEFLKDGAANPIEPIVDHEVLKELLNCDVLVPVFHGPYGEDGIIQGFFDTLDKAYVGADHTSAAICMDKAMTKYLMQVQGIPTLPFIALDHEAWKQDSTHWLQQIEQKLAFPVFVKPVHLGSTVGVQKVDQKSELKESIQKAFQFDYKLIVEQGIANPREIEFAVLGNENAHAFPPGEILTNGKVYDYDAKYGPNGIKAVPRADLPEQKIQEGMELALKAYKAVGCTGMARVDFFLDATQKFWLNEINPIPGFTPNSLYPKMCEVNGIPGNELLDRLIQLALERKRRNAVLCRSR
jgi:UDP-N-acetylmuramate--alanine ligase